MDYYKAKDIRKQGLISLMAERLSSGVGTGSAIGGSISDKTKATFTGIKQRFDPLNIARVVTGGSKFAPALLGALTGRSKRDIGFFTGKKKREFANLKNSPVQNSSQFAQYLGQIYNLLMKIENDRKLELDERQRQKEENDLQENRRNQALIEALTARKKPKVTRKQTKKLDDANKKVDQEKKKTDKLGKPKEEPVTPPKEVTKPTVPAPQPTPTAPAPTPKPTPTAKPPVAPAPKPPTAGKIGGGQILTGGAIAGTAALIGKESLAANISKYESGEAGYNAYNKGTVGNRIVPSDKPIDFSKMTIQDYFDRSAKTKQFPQGNPNLKPGDAETLFAVGRYQIIPPTMLELVKKLKLDPKTTYLDPATQDLLFANGLIGQQRKKVDAYVKGQSDDRDGAILELAKEFASVGIPYDMTVGDKKLKKGNSYYSGVGGNVAHNSPEQVGAALDADRLKNMQGNKSSVVPSVSTGNKIDSDTKENMGLKKSMQQSPVINKSVNNTNVNNKTVSDKDPEKEDDTNPLIKKARST